MPLCRLLEKVRITLPVEGQRQRDTDCDLFTLALGACDCNEGFVTGVTFDCFGALFFTFSGGGRRFDSDFGSFLYRLRRWLRCSEPLPYFDHIRWLNIVSCRQLAEIDAKTKCNGVERIASYNGVGFTLFQLGAVIFSGARYTIGLTIIFPRSQVIGICSRASC